MQPKSAIFISVTLTVFVLGILAGVANALKTATAAVEVTAAPATATSLPTAVPPTAEPEPTATEQPLSMGPMEAVSIASQFMNKQDVYSVESTTYNQAPAYKVTFTSGDLVYVGLDGQVITTDKLKPVVVNVAPTKAPKKNKDSNQSAPQQSSSGEREDEHEEEHDDDHD